MLAGLLHPCRGQPPATMCWLPIRPRQTLFPEFSLQNGVVAYEGDFVDDTEMYVYAFCGCEALMAPSIALKF